MTAAHVNKMIREGKPVTLKNTLYGETFTCTPVRKERGIVITAEGQVFHYDELEIVMLRCIHGRPSLPTCPECRAEEVYGTE